MAEDFEALRRHGFGVAYRMLGTVADAEDVVQEALARLARVDEHPDEPAAWVTTVTTRLAIDQLRRERVKRERYVGPWLPEPLIEGVASAVAGPAEEAEFAESLSQAFLVVLEQLTPVERAAFLLHVVFDYPYTEVAAILGRSPVSCRQLVARARKHLAAGRPRFDADPELARCLLERFLAAAEEGDVAGLEAVLAEDAVLYADGGGQVVAARRPLVGAARIARMFVAVTRKTFARDHPDAELIAVNGQPGQVLRGADGGVLQVLSIDVEDGLIRVVRIVRNPDKLAHVGAVTPHRAGLSSGSRTRRVVQASPAAASASSWPR